MREMEKLQARGELSEEELRAYEEDVTGRVRNSSAHQLLPNYYTAIIRLCWRRGEGLALNVFKFYERFATKF